MGVLDCHHPDIVEFITAKQQSNRLTKFNVSVNVSDLFMNRLEQITVLEKELNLINSTERDDNPLIDSVIKQLETRINELDEWELIFPDTTFEHYKKEWTGDIEKWKSKEYPIKVYQTISLRWLWNLMIESTYNRAEPGILFLDRANHFNPANYIETIFATNPCGEQTLSPGNICCLGSLNLTQFVIDFPDGTRGFNYEAIIKNIKVLVRFLDNVNSYSTAPRHEYLDAMRSKRRIGCGVMGWGSALFMLRVKFGSSEAEKIQETLMKIYAKSAYEASIDLAIEKGMFDKCDPVKHANGVFIQSIGLSKEYQDKILTTGIRNSSLMSQQPTGATSILANVVSGGIEPVFMTNYIRTTIVPHLPDHMVSITPKWFEGEWFETDTFKFTTEGNSIILRGTVNDVVYKIDASRGLVKEVECEDYGVRWLKARGEWDPLHPSVITTTELGVDEHVRDLKGFARWTDSACSKTVNVPNDYPFEDFKNLYLTVYKTGYIKGITTYRAGTMASVLSVKEELIADDSAEEIILDDVKIPDSSPATMKQLRADGKKWYLTVIMNETQLRPIAFFVQTNHHEKNVSTHNAVDLLISLARGKNIPEKYIKDIEEKILNDNNVSKIARTISLNLRHGVMIKSIVKTLNEVENVFVGSFLFAIRKYLSTFIKDGEVVDNLNCEDCGGTIIYQEGCFKCKNCGSSKCG